MIDGSKIFNSDESFSHRNPEPKKGTEFWNVKDPVKKALHNSFMSQYTDVKEKEDSNSIPIYPLLPNKYAKNSQIVVFQHIFTLPSEVDVDFRLDSNPIDHPDSKPFDDEVDALSSAFSATFDASFSIDSGEMLNFGKYAFSSLIGGLGYFEGRWLQLNRELRSVELAGPDELITTVPCRSFFPRGFLWDEGFHLLPILRFKPEIAKVIVASWINLMNNDGWIAREQILGTEARSKVCKFFPLPFSNHVLRSLHNFKHKKLM
jgi:mannosyl-oligosaccharide glucosidase